VCGRKGMLLCYVSVLSYPCWSQPGREPDWLGRAAAADGCSCQRSVTTVRSLLLTDHHHLPLPSLASLSPPALSRLRSLGALGPLLPFCRIPRSSCMADYKALKAQAAKASQAKAVAEAARLVAEKAAKQKLEREKVRPFDSA
jgi:hypothetical protein